MRRVVVTGVGAITPVGNDIDSFWNNLINAKVGVDFITRYDASNDKVKIAAEIKDFEPTLYMEKSEVRKTDLFAQYAIAAATQAMEDSDINGKIDPEMLGVYVGSGIGGISTIVTECEKFATTDSKRVSPYFVPMMIANMAAGKVAIKYNAQGVCLPVVTACATGTHAIGEAFRAIKFGYADAIIAGGSEACIVPLAISGFTSCMALSTKNEPQNSSIPFDKNRDGFVMGEGAGMLILEEYEHAIKRGAKIYAEVSGYGNTCDAHHITAPHPEALGGARAIKQAVAEAELVGNDKIYINAHGTSTPLNDKSETLAIKTGLGEDIARKVLISSTKSMTGHMLGAAGAVEAIAAILAIKNGIVPPTANLREADPDCDLDYVPLVARKAELDGALSISLGFGGHNACVAFKKV